MYFQAYLNISVEIVKTNFITVMEDGEHWYHTPEQLQVLNLWENELIADIVCWRVKQADEP